jgi:uncharacterized protein
MALHRKYLKIRKKKEHKNMLKGLSVNLATEAEEILEKEIEASPKKRWIYYSLLILIALIALLFLLNYFGKNPFEGLPTFIESLFQKEFLLYILVGFVAQMIDGALGMAYGVSSTSFLLSMGVTPAAASAGVHVAEVFTTGVSGLSHLSFGNVNKKLFKNLIIPGIIGAVIGAYILTSIDGNAVKPFISAYLLVMGIIIIKKAFNKVKKKKKTKRLAPLALFGGFVDSIGGGGWGPVVTSTLISKGRNAKYTIGSVNLAEFFIALASAGTFTIIMGFQSWQIVLGLIVGGVIAAPLAALVVGKVKTKTLMIMVGVLIIGLSLRTIILALI